MNTIASRDQFKPIGIKENLMVNYNCHYYSFKILPRFWLVRTTRIDHHNQLLLTKYWTNDIKSAARCKWLNRWRQNDFKVQPVADYWTVDRENLRTRLCYIWRAEEQRAKWRNSFENGKIFWMNNKAIIEFGFRRIWRVLQISEVLSTSAFGPCGSHPPRSAEFFKSYSAKYC